VDRDLEQALRQLPDYVEMKHHRTWPGRGREAGLVWYFCVAYLGTQGLVYVDGYRTELTEPARIVFRNVTTGGLPFPDGCR
jgi:hypothetical protein